MTYSVHYLENNPACKETYLKLTISGGNLNPNQYTEALEFRPTKAFAKGDTFQTRSGDRVRLIGQWSFNTKEYLTSTSVEAHARFLLERIEPKLDILARLLREEKHKSLISIWWEGIDYHGGFTLSSDTMRRLSQICEEISFFFISSDNEEETSENMHS